MNNYVAKYCQKESQPTPFRGRRMSPLEILGTLALIPVLFVGGSLLYTAEKIRDVVGVSPYDLDNESQA